MKNKKKNKEQNRSKKSLLEGRTFVGNLQVSLRGKGFVIVPDQEQDVMVRPENLRDGIDGDKVRVKVTKISSKGKIEGEIVEVIEHLQTEFIGRIELSEQFAFFIPEKKTMHQDIFVGLQHLHGAKDNDRVLVRVIDWHAGEDKNPKGEVIEIFRNERENDIAMKEILIENGFPLQFSSEALKEADALPVFISEEEVSKRKDCREVMTMTIDPADAKDFDDALSFRKLKNGRYEIGVHIADVSHYVRTGTHLDAEAYDRATSVYLPDRVLPMLPEVISNQLCSLRPDEDKRTFSVIFQFDEKGSQKHHWIGQTIIRSKKRFAYEEVQAIIEGGESPFKEEIETLNRIAQKLRKKRIKDGAINFSSRDVRFQLDEEAKPVGVVVKTPQEAHQLIEEFMLLANRTVAAFAQKKEVNQQPIPFPYRVHDVPDEEKIKLFAAFARRLGYPFPLQDPEKISSSFNDMLRLAKGKPELAILEQLGIRTMSKAFYTTENIGHYGLHFQDYAHFTSPIRRYPDILAHRVLKQILEDDVQIDKKMEEKAKHCSERERKAMEAERAANKYKQVEYMQQFVGEQFDAVISGVATIGFWAETIETRCEGFVPAEELAGLDEFQFKEEDYALVGRFHGERFQIGDTVSVIVSAVSLEKRQIDFVLAAEPRSSGTSKRRKTDREKSRRKKK